ncbi:hypothetical protein [Streptomyces sp. NPDC090036]|uniref:hypothetical protein n=1 Tax=Streptomyces sp. NPDC090036 TaxID=3365926 RepID=UPI00382C62F1
MFTVRRAGPYDGDVLGEIHAAAWEAAYAPFFDPGFAADGVRSRRTRWHERVGQADTPILLAEHEGRPLALTAFRASAPRSASAPVTSGRTAACRGRRGVTGSGRRRICAGAERAGADWMPG